MFFKDTTDYSAIRPGMTIDEIGLATTPNAKLAEFSAYHEP